MAANGDGQGTRRTGASDTRLLQRNPLMRAPPALFVLLVLVAGCDLSPFGKQSDSRTATINGWVRDTAGLALVGVDVVVEWPEERRSTQTGADGGFSVPVTWKRSSGALDVQVSATFTKAGLQPKTLVTDLWYDSNTLWNVFMRPSAPYSITVSGMVTVAGETTPIAGAQVDVRFGGLPSPPADFSAVTDGGGSYVMRLSWPASLEEPNGSVYITTLVSRSDFEPVARSSVVFANRDVGYNVSLTPSGRCTGPVAVEVADLWGNPTFSWAPACRLWSVLVEEDGSGDDQWNIASDGTNSIIPPVTYYAIPYGARELLRPKPLIIGVAYRVSVFRFTGPGAEDGELVGMHRFIPGTGAVANGNRHAQIGGRR